MGKGLGGRCSSHGVGEGAEEEEAVMGVRGERLRRGENERKDGSFLY